MTAMEFSRERLERIESIEPWHFWFVARASLVERLIQTHVPPGARLLDAGCGTGALLRSLAALGVRATGIDRRPEGLVLSRKMSHLPVIQGDIERLPFAAESLDAISLIDVLEHVDDRVMMREMQTALRPGGILIATVPAFPFLWSFRDDAAGHRRRYRRRDLSGLAQSAGFRVVDSRYFQCFLFPILAIARLLGRGRRRLRDIEEAPAPWLNAILLAVTRLELRLGRVIRWPWGSTLAFVCVKELR